MSVPCSYAKVPSFPRYRYGKQKKITESEEHGIHRISQKMQFLMKK